MQLWIEVKTVVIKFEMVPPEEAPQNYFRRSAAIIAGLVAFNVMHNLLKQTELAFALRLVLSLVVYSFVANLIYPFWRVRFTRRQG